MVRAAIGLTVLALAAPLSARAQNEPVANRTPNVTDVAMTPITDLNLARDEIPPVLLAAADNPYASAGLADCAGIAAALEPLDAALGPDMDVAETSGERISAGAVAKSVVASFIPFRGILREITGAADHQRDFQAAIYAGAVRRGFLKGLGQQMQCDYPARPAFARVTVSRKDAPPAQTDGTAADGFVAEAVVQPLPPARDRRR